MLAALGRNVDEHGSCPCRQTCKSAAAGPHRQPPNCLGNLLIATAPPALSGQGWGQPGAAGRSKTLPREQGCAARSVPPWDSPSAPRDGNGPAWPPAAPHRPLPCAHKFVSASSQKKLSRHSLEETRIILEQSSYDWSDFHNTRSANICLLFKARLHWDRTE